MEVRLARLGIRQLDTGVCGSIKLLNTNFLATEIHDVNES